MERTQRIRPEGLVSSPASSHVAIVPPGATTIYVGGLNGRQRRWTLPGEGAGTLVGEGDVARR